jgi:hypothetical protein
VRSVRRGQPVSQLSNGGPAPNLLYRHRPGRRHPLEQREAGAMHLLREAIVPARRREEAEPQGPRRGGTG